MPKKAVPHHQVVRSERLSSSRKGDRYVVIDPDTGEILDDANGYGYKTRQKAHAGFGYKLTHSKKQTQAEKRKAEEWWKKHEKLADDINDEILCAVDDGMDFDFKGFKRMIEESGEDLGDLTPRILWRYW